MSEFKLGAFQEKYGSLNAIITTVSSPGSFSRRNFYGMREFQEHDDYRIHKTVLDAFRKNARV